MSLIILFIALVACFMVVGLIVVLADKPKRESEEAEDEYPPAAVSQEVPSVFDTFNGKKK